MRYPAEPPAGQPRFGVFAYALAVSAARITVRLLLRGVYRGDADWRPGRMTGTTVAYVPVSDGAHGVHPSRP
jgi:hypothetical protein